MNNTAFWNKASTKLGCPTSDVKASIACMRKKSMTEILQASAVGNPLQAVLGDFGPSVDNRVVFGDYKERAAAGKFIQKPYMTGNNDFEAGLFVLIAEGAHINISANIWPVFNAGVFTCPISRSANARAARGLTTYLYRYFPDYPNTFLLPKSQGAYHTSEIPQIFGTAAKLTGEANTPSEQKLSRFLQSAWAAFAKDPESLKKPPFSFPAYNPKDSMEKTLIGFGAYENANFTLLPPFNYDMYCDAIMNLLATSPGGIAATIQSVASGGELGIPGLKVSDLPDMSPRPLPKLGN
jgi:cholinesterase